MAETKPPPEAVFFCGALIACDHALEAARATVRAAWGPPALESPLYPFTDTDYYAEETGPAIRRVFWGWDGMFSPDELASRKRQTNALEADIARTGVSPWPRPVNLDPGYLTRAKLVLASAKDFAHRIWIGGGIYAEVTRNWRHGAFVNHPWTFPDYASGRYDDFFLALRKQLGRKGRVSN